MEKEIFICQCCSLEHQLIFYKDEYEVFCYPHLITYRGFWKRLWHGLKYAFGHKSRFGAFDQFIFEPDDLIKLKQFLNS